jgi:hypothetical protein
LSHPFILGYVEWNLTAVKAAKFYDQDKKADFTQKTRDDVLIDRDFY